MLIAILLTSYSSISQTVTESKIILDTITAREVIKDLIECDVAKAKLKIANKIIIEQDNQIKLHEDISKSLEQSILNYEIMLSEKDNIITNKDALIENANKALKKQKRQTTFYKITTAIFVVTSAIFIFK